MILTFLHLVVAFFCLSIVRTCFTFQAKVGNKNPFVHSNLHSKRKMFSGIVEDIGEVMQLQVNKQMKMWDGTISEGVELTVKSIKAVEEAYIGCSIAVNGVCLTAIDYDEKQFTVGLAPETLRRSNLGALKVGSKVNVERALRADGRNSGHFVQGHVDCTATILKKWQENDSLWVKLEVPPAYIRYIVPKGFIAIDGTSLTVCDVNVCKSSSETKQQQDENAANLQSLDKDNERNWFTIMLVSHTQQNVIFPSKEVGDQVNIEVDVLGKLVESSLQASVSAYQDQIAALQSRSEQQEERIQKLEKHLNTLLGNI